MKSNFCDIPTDCPTRERAGWTGDAGVFAAAGLRLMECAPVYEKWLANLRLNQFEDGELPYICPPNGPSGQMASLFRASVGWGDACVIVPWEIYRLDGDVDVLRENYEMMTKWIHFLMARAKQKRNPDPYDGNPLQDYIINTGMIPEKICCECPACYMKTSASNAFAFRKKSIERLRADLPCKLPIGSF